MNTEPLTCSICQLPLSPGNCRHNINVKFGNNAWPINNGRCCDDCNEYVVIPARINQIRQGEKIRSE